MELETYLDQMQIFFQGLPTNGQFEPRKAKINWTYTPILSSAKDKIENFDIEIKTINLEYAYNLNPDELESDSPTESMDLLSPEWSFDVIVNRMEDETFVSVEISSITIDFSKKTAEILFNY